MSIHAIRRRPTTATVRAVGVVALPLIAVATLHVLAARPWAQIVWTDLPTWLATTPREDATVALARIVCLGVSYWLLLGTCAAVISRLFDLRWATALSQHVTPSAVRRFVDRTVVATAATGVLVTGAALPAADVLPTPIAHADVMAAPPPPGVAPPPAQEDLPADGGDRDEGPPAEEAEEARAPEEGGAETEQRGAAQGSGTTDVEEEEDDDDVEEDVEEEEDDDDVEEDDEEGDDDRSSSDVHTVATGENLWAIAHHHLAEVRGVPTRDVSTAEIVGYWCEVIAVNRERLRSGDPDLIYPGERILLPPTGSNGTAEG